jgi:hypothetical protein
MVMVVAAVAMVVIVGMVLVVVKKGKVVPVLN